MTRVPWVPSVLRSAGCEVEEIAGCYGRGREMDTVYGVVGHDTVTTDQWRDEDVVALLRDGRSSVPGPLSQLGLNRDGIYCFIADGRSNHNGYGLWGNDSIGIEVFAAGGLSGREERWNSTQEDAFVLGARAILEYLDLPPSDYWNPRAAGHKETDPDRKQDPWGVDMNEVRRAINATGPNQHRLPPPEEDEMIILFEDGNNLKLLYTGSGRIRHLQPNAYDAVKKLQDKVPEQVVSVGEITDLSKAGFES